MNQDMLEQDGWVCVPQWMIANAKARVAKLAKAAKRCGFAAPVLVMGNEWKQTAGEPGNSYEVAMIALRLDGELPKLPGGWHLLARVETVGGARMVFPIPGASDMPERVWCEEHVCDHCNKKRNRAKTFILGNDSGETKRIGSNCLADFLGHKINLKSYEPDLSNLEDEERGRRSTFMGLFSTIIYTAVGVMRVDGVYKKASEFEAWPTRRTIWLTMCNPGSLSKEERRHIEDYKPAESDHAIAQEVENWCANLNPTNDYERNIKSIWGCREVHEKSFGVACSIVGAYFRATQKKPKLVETTPASEAPAVQIVNGPTGRFKITGKVLSAKRLENEFGVTNKALIECQRSENEVYKVWLTVPSCINKLPERGVSVSVVVTITPGNEVGFMIGKRPAEWVQL